MFCDSEAICVNFDEKRMTFMHIYAYATAVGWLVCELR